MGIDVPVYPPSTFLVLTPLTVFHYSLGALPLVPFEWLPVGHFRCSGFIHMSAVSTLARYHSSIPDSGYERNSAGGGSTGNSRHRSRDHRQLPFSAWAFPGSGAFLLMLSLAIKPQIGGLLALYFLTQKPYRRYAAVALAGALTLLVCSGLSLRLHPQSANWISTLRANLGATTGPGGSADPRQANQEAIGDTNLQTLTSIFFVEARTFNSIAYAIFLGLLTAWIIAVPWSNASLETHFLSLAALSILSLMPMYHRFYDTRLLLLTVPAVAVIFQKRRILGGFIAVLTVLAVISVQYRVQLLLIQNGSWQRLLHHPLLFILLLRQQNLELLLLFGLYLAAILGVRRSVWLPYEIKRAPSPGSHMTDYCLTSSFPVYGTWGHPIRLWLSFRSPSNCTLSRPTR